MGSSWRTTAGSHTELRQFFTDIMNGYSLGYAFISEVTLTLLEDTGWYDVDMTRAEPLAFGNWRSISGATVKNFTRFVDGEPALRWPKHYVSRTANEAVQPKCTYDLLAYGRRASWGTLSGCSEASPPPQCAYPGFYDATNTGHFGDPPTDYALVNIPTAVICRSTRAANATSGEAFGAGSFCGMSTINRGGARSSLPACFPMRCDSSGQVFVTVGGVEKPCTGATQTWEGFEGALTCPDPAVLCGMIDYFASAPAPTRSPVATPCPGGLTVVAPLQYSFEIERDGEATTWEGWLVAAYRVGDPDDDVYWLKPGGGSIPGAVVKMAVNSTSCDTVKVVVDITASMTANFSLAIYGDTIDPRPHLAYVQPVELHKHDGIWLAILELGLISEPSFTTLYAGDWAGNLVDVLWADTPNATSADVVAGAWKDIRLTAGGSAQVSVTFTTNKQAWDPPSEFSSSSGAASGMSLTLIIGIGAAGGVFLAASIVILICIVRGKRQAGEVEADSLQTRDGLLPEQQLHSYTA